jgi:processive 1,2-diacylglycerol beta-glucosyltransferase
MRRLPGGGGVKVLITSLSAGSGHVRAAEAILAACKQSSPAVEAVHVDVANFVSPNFRRFYVEGYRVAVQHAPGLWGRIYHYSDSQSPNAVLTPLLYRIQRSCASGFYAYLQRFRPDLILTTHFLIPQLISAERHHPSFGPPVETVITDYDVHRFWISNVVTRYYVAHEGMVDTLLRYGVPRSRVTVSGIPVHPSFLEKYSLERIARELELDLDRPIILMLSGGLGIYELQEAVQQLFKLPVPAQLITVSGRNELLRKRLDAMKAPSGITLRNLGYVQNMHELLAISDIVMTKPGGLSVSEGLAMKKLMILYSPIPGQEEKNAEFLLNRGAAVSIHAMKELPDLALRLLRDKTFSSQILSNVELCARPQAAFTIAETLTHASSLAA